MKFYLIMIGWREISPISDSSIGIVHVQERRFHQEPPKEIEKCYLNEKIIYNCPLEDNMVVQGCCP